MLPRPVAEFLTDSLCGMARANWFEFQRDPVLCRRYLSDLRSGNHRYVADKITCGLPDCWSSYRGLVERYGKGPLLLDCEDAACALSGWLASQCYKKDRILVGLVPGRKISHAITGVMKPDGTITILDPARWAGMGPTSYENPVWRDVATKLAPEKGRRFKPLTF